MALVNCPECKKPISDTTDKCIGCGAELKKCPECGVLLIKNAAFCSNCGYRLTEMVEEEKIEEKIEEAKEEKENISSEVGAQRLIKHFDDFKGENPGIKGTFWYNHKGLTMFMTLISTLIVVAMFVPTIFSSLISGNMNMMHIKVFGGFLSFFLLYFALTFLVFSPVAAITGTVERIHISGRFSEYCEKNAIDLYRYTSLASYVIPSKPSNNKDIRPFYLSLSKDALYYAANPAERTKYKVYSIIE